MQKEKSAISDPQRGKVQAPLLICLTAILLVTVLAVVRYPKGEVNFRNADATWHTLLTIEAYDETPISEHLFLPIVNFGGRDNKFISWGATAEDAYGNHYYTSFSSAGFFFPWLFMHIFHLPVSISSLYIFNTVLFAVSAVLWIIFLLQVYAGQRERYILAVLGLVTYVMVPELLHSMGIVYWHQSILQITLMAQMIAFLQMQKTGSRGAAAAFYLLALVNPYIEWTGYVANVGFALAELLTGGERNFKRSFDRALLLGGITVLSAALFMLHYLLRVDLKTMLKLLLVRFAARSAIYATLYKILHGYFGSFLYLWPLLLLLLVWAFAIHRRVEGKYWPIVFLLAFTLLENCIMAEHARSYTFDRMKGIWLLSFLVCESSRQILAGSKKRGTAMAVIGAMTLFAGLFNVISYCQDERYVWPTDYQAQNRELARYINETYPDALLGMPDGNVRGYISMLFGKGIYNMPAGDIYGTAFEKGRRYVVTLKVDKDNTRGDGDVYKLIGAEVGDMQEHTLTELSLCDGQILSQEVELPGIAEIHTDELQDTNWMYGRYEHNDILLLDYSTQMLYKAARCEKVVCDGRSFTVDRIDCDAEHIVLYLA